MKHFSYNNAKVPSGEKEARFSMLMLVHPLDYVAKQKFRMLVTLQVSHTRLDFSMPAWRECQLYS